MAFQGFGPQAQAFFKGLAFHQTRDWFEANRAIYERDVKTPLGDLVEELAAGFAKSGSPLRGNRKASLFRLNRDVRFSKDKSLYKTQAGAVLTRSGVKQDKGHFYIHIAPESCFAAAGFYHPEPSDLAQLRRAIARSPKDWTRLVAILSKKGLALSEEGALQRLPRGFEAVADPAIAAAVKRKSLVCTRPIDSAQIYSRVLLNDLQVFARDASPLLEWGWEALLDER